MLKEQTNVRRKMRRGTAAFAVRPRVYIIVAMPLFASRYWNIFSVENSMFIAAM